MIKKDYYATNKEGDCVNYGFSCFSCSHWHGYLNNGSCDMFKTTFTTISLSQCEMTEKRLIRTINDVFENYNELDKNTPIVICHNGIKYDVAFHIDNPDEFIIVTGKKINK